MTTYYDLHRPGPEDVQRALGLSIHTATNDGVGQQAILKQIEGNTGAAMRLIFALAENTVSALRAYAGGIDPLEVLRTAATAAAGLAAGADPQDYFGTEDET